MDHMDPYSVPPPQLVLEKSCHTSHSKVACLSPSPIRVHLVLVGSAGDVGVLEAFCFVGIRMGCRFYDSHRVRVLVVAVDCTWKGKLSVEISRVVMFRYGWD
jgi:hypothetical protein